MGLKVIGAGFGRTGTTSLRLALNQIGVGPCHHMEHVTNALAAKLHAVKLGGKPDWDALLGSHQSAIDWPWSAFYKELMEHYPDAKVILTVRDPEKWYASAARTIGLMEEKAPPGVFRDFANAVIFDGVFDGQFFEKDCAIKKFNDHIEEVKKCVPGDRLLVFEVKDGWEPLCKFLNVPVPKEPFPTANNTEDFQKLAERKASELFTSTPM